MMATVVVGGRGKSLTLSGVDPETCMIVFKNHWAQVVKILEKHETSRSGALSFFSSHGGAGPIPADEASAVQNYVEHMLFLLMEEEAGQGGAMGPILELVVLEGVMERLFLWSLRRQFTEDMKLEQLRMYQNLLSQARQPLLHHKPVLKPLMMLLASCAGPASESGGAVEAELVLLLNQLCAALVRDPSVLELFFHTSEDQGAANFLLFSLLIPYTHRQGSVGQQARDALLLIMSLSAKESRVAQHITDNTYFCPVLATGLSGLYSSLPARLQVYSEDWHCLDQADWHQVPALVHFLHSLDFCSAVVKVAHPSIRCQLLSYIYNGFLVPVLAPALHKLTVEEVMTTTAYLDLFLRSVSEPALLHTFLSFILLHTHDTVHILDTLVSRINTPFQLGTVSLALFRTLIGLFCEDVMLQLVFRFLIPFSHLTRRGRSLSDSSSSFLLLLPSWCPKRLQSSSDHIQWSKAAGPSVAYFRGCDFLMDVNYLHYLWDAQLNISTAHRACRLWSAPYDGIDPSPFEWNVRGEEVEDDCAPLLVTISPTPSSTDTAIQTGRASSALELEWEDFLMDDDPSTSGLTNGDVNVEADMCATPPPPPPKHLQEMQRTAIKLVHGSYVEESEFQDDVLVYDLVAQKDAERQRSVSSSQRAAAVVGRTVTNTVNSIMLRRRRSEDTMSVPDNIVTNGIRSNNHIVCKCDEIKDKEIKSQGKENLEETSSVVTHELSKSPSLPETKDSFTTQYHQLMVSLGAEPECDDVTCDIATFRRRVGVLRQKLEGDDNAGFDFSCGSIIEEEEEELMTEEETSIFIKDQDGRHKAPFTGPFISVLLSRLENLLENSIAVNLLVTGILAQLASYPQPLLRSFLLDTDAHEQPNVRRLYQVLMTVRAQIERYMSAHPDYNALVRQAWRFLLAKDQDAKLRECLQCGGSGADKTNGSVNTNFLPLPSCPPVPPNAKSRVFAIVLYAEFLKELAAISLEHSIALDCPHEE
ncbi:protein FAM160A1-like [Gouania willdenowi]|uniref:protein FAM160A1-like n=1 Tax=Gouania willdenowi TaxID=441366 RepID=UPI0010556271|nr:protein FAM160A1-like [Gouania willdenowi]